MSVYSDVFAAGDRKVLMFAGKGGVGKTTCAATAALHYASQGERILAISTDPTPSLSHIFEVRCNQSPTRISSTLYIDEVGAAEVKKMWDRKFGREVYEVFSSFVDVEYDDFVDFVISILPGMRDEFVVDYIRSMLVGGDYTRIIWDTAPLGQTLSLLKMPAMLSKHLKMAPRIYSKLKLGTDSRRPVLDIIRNWEKLSDVNMEFLRNEVGFVMVTLPEALAVEQLDGILKEFDSYGLSVGQLIINNVISDLSSEFLMTRYRQQIVYLETLHRDYGHIKMVELPMLPEEIKGINRLASFEKHLFVG